MIRSSSLETNIQSRLAHADHSEAASSRFVDLTAQEERRLLHWINWSANHLEKAFASARRVQHWQPGISQIRGAGVRFVIPEKAKYWQDAT